MKNNPMTFVLKLLWSVYAQNCGFCGNKSGRHFISGGAGQMKKRMAG